MTEGLKFETDLVIGQLGRSRCVGGSDGESAEGRGDGTGGELDRTREVQLNVAGSEAVGESDHAPEAGEVGAQDLELHEELAPRGCDGGDRGGRFGERAGRPGQVVVNARFVAEDARVCTGLLAIMVSSNDKRPTVVDSTEI